MLRSARLTGALALGLSVVGAALTVPAVAERNAAPAPTATDIAAVDAHWGDARPVLLESVEAPGKVAVLGAGTWPVANTTIATTPAGVAAQAIALHPVDGVDGAHVLEGATGGVLARIDGSRDVELLDIEATEAAAQPRATWVLTTHEDVTKVVNGEPYEGVGQALDLYDWSHADGARVATWDDNDFGTNQSWRVHDLVATPEAVGGIVAPGEAPTLPTELAGTYSWGLSVALEGVEWAEPDASVWESDGEVVVDGTATGAFGEELMLEAVFTVGTVGDALPAELTSYAGVLPELLRGQAPATVERTISGTDATVTADVRWDWDAITAAELAEVGVVTVPAVEGTGFAASLEVTLVEPESANLLRTTPVRGWRKDGATDLSKLTDGDTSAEGFGDWKSGGAANRVNPNWVAYYFDTPRQVNAASVDEFSGANNIGAVTFQYRSIHGGWVDVSAGRIENTGGRLVLDTEFDSVLATGFRVVFEHKSTASWMQLAEFEVWGPSLGS
jgi:hypothetical protein